MSIFFSKKQRRQRNAEIRHCKLLTAQHGNMVQVSVKGAFILGAMVWSGGQKYVLFRVMSLQFSFLNFNHSYTKIILYYISAGHYTSNHTNSLMQRWWGQYYS